jgi:Tol biopolymer transport system component
MRRWSTGLANALTAAVLGTVLLMAPVTHAAYPGENGRIAFKRSTSSFSTSIYTMNPDGSDVVVLPGTTEANVHYGDPAWTPDGNRLGFVRSVVNGGRTMLVTNADGSSPQQLPGSSSPFGPTWSPDGSRFAFSEGCCGFTHIFSANLDGTGLQKLTGTDPDDPDLGAGENPVWSPTGGRIAYQGLGRHIDDGDDFIGNDGALTVLASGGGEQPVPNQPIPDRFGVTYVDWSPAGHKVAISAPVTVGCNPMEGCSGFGPHDIWVIETSGSSPAVNLTNSTANEGQPAWSPDGTKIAFASSAGTGGIFSMNADGTGVTQLTTGGFMPSWQPVQRPHARPKGATPFRVALVPAMQPCTAPNREHGPPLAFPSCNPPQPESPNITVSQGDARLRSVGFVRMDVLAGAPGAPDDTDVQIRFSLTNVMQASDFAAYTGSLTASIGARLTDRDGGQSSTTQDFPFSYAVPCAATADTFLGSTCASTTSFDALVPGAAAEGSRAIWALERLQVYDEQDVLFATQGVFAP